MLNRMGTNHGCITTNPNQSMLQYNGNIPVHLQPKSSNFKVMPPAGKVMLTMFWDSQKHGENVNSTLFGEVLLKLRDTISRKCLAQLTRGVLLPSWQCQTPYSLSNPEENSKTTVGTSWTSTLQPGLAPSDFHLFGPLKNHLGCKRFADMEVQKWLRQQSKGFCACGFQRNGKVIGIRYQYWYKICRAIHVFLPGSNSTGFMFYIICDLFTNPPLCFPQSMHGSPCCYEQRWSFSERIHTSIHLLAAWKIGWISTPHTFETCLRRKSVQMSYLSTVHRSS
jgi:hypothetical protein